MKRCPFCAEEIQDAAIICRYCQSKQPPAPLAQHHSADRIAGDEPVTSVTSVTPAENREPGAGDVAPEESLPPTKSGAVALVLLVVFGFILFLYLAQPDRSAPAPTVSSPASAADQVARERERDAARKKEIEDEIQRFSAADFGERLKTLERRVTKGDLSTEARAELNERLNEIQPLLRSDRAKEPAIAAVIERFRALERAFVGSARTANVAPAAAPQAPEQPPSRDAAGPAIRSRCAAEWKDDFRMRAYCERQQTEALDVLSRRDMSRTPDLQTIRRTCFREWGDDFRMRDYCERTQLEALQQLR